MKLSPLMKGVITGITMIGVSFAAYKGLPADSPLHYLAYAVYALGIVWTLVAYSKSPEFPGRFGDSFNTGFRCFIVATLLMVLYTFVFIKQHPEFAEESSRLYKEEQLKKKEKLPADIDSDTARYKNGYAMAVVYGSIFGYLIMGAAVAAATSALLTRRKS